MMTAKIIHQCKCKECKDGTDLVMKEVHHQMNVMMSRLDEQQRRWYAAVEAKRLGRGGITRVRRITGLDDKTIRRGMAEMSKDLSDRPTERVRAEGGGRPRVEKKRK